MRELTNAFNASIQATKHQLQFSLDDASGKTIIKVIDSATDKVIRQFPPEQVVAVARAIKASLSEDGGEPLGVLLEAKG
ncbi:MAG: flagellar protein FlaG [Gammaproteobacteria bacterium]|nr:flagellar protein FlaG [Gammaproteobacteria bacterium]